MAKPQKYKVVLSEKDRTQLEKITSRGNPSLGIRQSLLCGPLRKITIFS